MQHLVDDVRSAVNARNWYAALSLALALPDIAGRLEYGPVGGSNARFSRWFAAFVAPRFIDRIMGQPGTGITLSAGDCYALRCAYLHQGELDLSEHHAREVLSRFVFVNPEGSPVGSVNHPARQLLLLRVDNFCHALCEATEAWLADVRASRPDVSARVGALPRIHTFVPGERLDLGGITIWAGDLPDS
jgi:hypothetical protein